MNDINLNRNSYENTPSPSSIASSISVVRSSKYRHRISSSTLKNDHTSSNKRRHRHFHKQQKMVHTQLLKRQYLFSLATIFGRMQRQIKKLKWRAQRVEQLLITRTSCGKPVIRIPRLTHDQLSTICINDDDSSTMHEENLLDNIDSSNTTTESTSVKIKGKNVKRLDQPAKGKNKRLPPVWINFRQQPIDKDRYCPECRFLFTKRSNYVNHVKRLHQGVFPTTDTGNIDEQIIFDDSSSQDAEAERSLPLARSIEPANEITPISTDQLVEMANNNETESFRLTVNQWDEGEGRLRPRAIVKMPTSKAKCDACRKFFRVDYLKKHQKHCRYYSSPSKQLPPSTESMIEHIPTPSSESTEECTKTNDCETANNQPPTIQAEIDVDDIPIGFRKKEVKKPIVLAVTCLENYQLELIEQFLAAFPKRVSQSAAIDSSITHVIANDRLRPLRAPLTIKLIEAIAHHCFCVSYRWIIECLRKEQIIDELPYEIEGDDTEINPHGGPRRSRLASIRHSLFRGICFMIKCTENSEAKMTNERLQELITTCGGQTIQCVTHRLLEQFEIIVLCDMTYLSARRHNYEQCRSLGIHFVSSDWVLESILEYHCKPYAFYEEMPL